jgi:hypothetical protein
MPVIASAAARETETVGSPQDWQLIIAPLSVFDMKEGY